MNFIGNKLIPASLFAATASVIIAGPAQALNLGTNSSFEFSSVPGSSVQVDIPGVNGATDYFFDFEATLSAPNNAQIDLVDAGPFELGDFFIISDFGVTAGGDLIGAPIDPFMSGIGTTLAAPDDEVSFVMTGLKSFFDDGSDQIIMNFAGYFENSDASGTQLGAGLLELSYNKTLNSFSGSLATDIPTPAAVLPILTGLFGVASRKKQEEEV